jgi:transposase
MVPRANAVIRKALRRARVQAFFNELPTVADRRRSRSSANYWARELMKLGYTVKLMPPSYVKPHVKRGKSMESDL